MNQPRLVLGAVLAMLLGAVSIGASCGGAASEGSESTAKGDGQPTVGGTAPEGGFADYDAGDDAGSADEAEEDGGLAAETGTPSPAFGDGGQGAASDAAGDTSAQNTVIPGCVLDFETCPGPSAGTCCNGGAAACALGACGGVLAEGEVCHYDGSVVPSGQAPCQNGLPCVGGFCGTNACVPDGTPCGADAGVVCCNDNCNGSICAN